jgi:RNA recognition motif-containing protein
MSNQIICRKCGGNHFTLKCNNNNNNKIEEIKTYTISISNLPNDINKYELHDLLKEWGNINKIKVKNYDYNSVAFIDFTDKKQSDYFIKALDKTPFEHEIITVEYAKSDKYSC